MDSTMCSHGSITMIVSHTPDKTVSLFLEEYLDKT